MAINQEKKSNRLLGSRRFTSADLNTSQEAFQSNLDIQASEVYTQANLIPTSSLPFSGSSQNGNIHQVNSNDILLLDGTNNPSLGLPNFTGKKEVYTLGYSLEPNLTISQSAPLPFRVLGITTEVYY